MRGIVPSRKLRGGGRREMYCQAFVLGFYSLQAGFDLLGLGGELRSEYRLL